MKKYSFIFVLISLLFFQLIYSFLFPTYPLNENWLPINTYLPKFATETTDNWLLEKIYPLISSEYRLNSDAGVYLEPARSFSPEYLKVYNPINRPLYPLLIYLLSLPFYFFAVPSFGVIFGLAILLNFIFAALTVLLFFLFLKKIFSLKIAYFSAILLIFSPYFHNSLIQPLPEMLMAFAAVLTAYFLYNYSERPSTTKLIVFSLIIGILLLGKPFYAISIFILLLAICFRRYKEGILFLIFHLFPLFAWYLFVTKVWQIPFYFYEIQPDWQMGIWIFKIFSSPWRETAQIFLTSIPHFMTVLIFSFLLIPVLFSAIGWKQLPFRSKNMIYFGAILSVFLLGIATKFYAFRHVFLLFPVIYPTAILGIERVADFLRKYKPQYSPLFYIIIIGFTIFISSINFQEIFDFDYLSGVYGSFWFLSHFFK